MYGCIYICIYNVEMYVIFNGFIFKFFLILYIIIFIEFLKLRNIKDIFRDFDLVGMGEFYVCVF